MFYKKNILFFYFMALAMPFIFFINLPFNIENSAEEAMMNNYFFNADSWRVIENLKDSNNISHYRDKVHPYFSLFAVSIAKLGGVSSKSGSEFLLYRLIFGTLGCFLFWIIVYKETKNILTAFSSSILILSSYALKIWSILPETYIFGFFTIMLSLYLIQIKSNPVLVFIASLSGTITNSFIGIAYLTKRMAFKKEFLTLIFYTIFSIVILSLLQKMIYPSSIHFFEISQLNEEKSFINESIQSIPFRAFDFIYSGFFIPLRLPWQAPSTLTTESLWSTFFNAPSDFGMNFGAGIMLAIIFISLLLFYSAYNFCKSEKKSEVNKIIVIFIIFQFSLHMIYGESPFLYSFHYLPAMVLFMAINLPKKTITPVLIIALAATLCFLHNKQIKIFYSTFG